jgi:ERCC4-type nuclease
MLPSDGYSMTKYLKTTRRKTKRRTKPPVILYDDREKRPWTFLQATNYGWKMERTHLKTGDYTFKGCEKKFCIEKKSGLAELFTNLSAKNRPTFRDFLRRLSEFQVKAIVVEDDLSTISQCVKLLREKSNNKICMNEDTIYYWVSRITVDYRIPILFTGRDIRTQCRMIHNLFTEAYECLQ